MVYTVRVSVFILVDVSLEMEWPELHFTLRHHPSVQRACAWYEGEKHNAFQKGCGLRAFENRVSTIDFQLIIGQIV